MNWNWFTFLFLIYTHIYIDSVLKYYDILVISADPATSQTVTIPSKGLNKSFVTDAEH